MKRLITKIAAIICSLSFLFTCASAIKEQVENSTLVKIITKNISEYIQSEEGKQTINKIDKVSKVVIKEIKDMLIVEIKLTDNKEETE